MSVDLKISNRNLLEWSNFEDWENGASAAPTGWTFAGAGASVAREGTIIRQGTYSAKITGDTSGTLIFYQAIQAEKGIAYWQGRKVTIGAWIYCATGNIAGVYIGDDVSSSTAYTTTTGTWEWVTVTYVVNMAATFVNAGFIMQPHTPAYEAYVDGAVVCEGTTTLLDIANYVETWDLARKYRNSKFTIARRAGVLVPDVEYGEKTLNLKGKIWGTTAANCRTTWDSFLQYMNTGEKDIYLFDDRLIRGYLVNESHHYIAALRVVEYNLQFIVQDPFNYYVQKLRTTAGVDASPKSFTVTNNGNVYAKPVINFIAGSVPCTAATFENLTTGETLTFTGTIAAYKTLIIDCQNLTVLNDGTDAIANFTGDFMKLNPGANSMLFTGTTSTRVQVDLNDRWL